MVQKEVSLCCVLAWVGWTVGFALALADLLLPGVPLTALAVLIGCGGGTLHIKGFVAGLERRDRRMFELGQESGRASVRPLR